MNTTSFQAAKKIVANPNGYTEDSVLVAQAFLEAERDAMRDQLDAALKAVEGVLYDAYHRGGMDCCGNINGSECCGDPIQVWDKSDNKIMDALSPVQRSLSSMLAAAPAQEKV